MYESRLREIKSRKHQFFDSVVNMVIWNTQKLFNISLLESNNDRIYNITNPVETILLTALGFCLMTENILGSGFYLWFFKTSSEQSQCRLLNILNCYLSGTPPNEAYQASNNAQSYYSIKVEEISINISIKNSEQ